MTDDEPLFVDTNILVYTTDAGSSWHRQAVEAIESARRGGIGLIVSPQIISEYLAVMTRASVSGGYPPVGEIVENVRTFLNDFQLVEENLLVISMLSNLVERISMGGKQIHDANIVATMQAHGIRRLLTHNTADFARFADVITVIPLVSAS